MAHVDLNVAVWGWAPAGVAQKSVAAGPSGLRS